MELYRHELIDHYRFPRHKGTLTKPDLSSGKHNPSCGDSVCFEAKIADGIIAEVAFEGSGCVISQASASLLAQHVRLKPITLAQDMRAETMQALIGMDLGPTRLACALLSLQALQAGLADYNQRR